jgi:hypothetical protein
VEKVVHTKICATSVVKKVFNVNNRPIGENSPNLVTLTTLERSTTSPKKLGMIVCKVMLRLSRNAKNLKKSLYFEKTVL